MNKLIDTMLSKYEINNIEDKKNAIKEVVQEIVLCGLSRGGFFNKAAFYGGTALRIFYNLDRFSEDLDFSLITYDKDFDLKKYFSYIKNEINSLGLNFIIEENNKTFNSNIKSAFLKGNTIEHILSFYDESQDINKINKDEVIRIKFEVDVEPFEGATYETKFRLLPSPYQVRLFDLSSLFAEKIHACLCRNWKSRVKGRDFYDYVFFLSIGAKVNLDFLKTKLIDSKYIDPNYNLNIENLKKMLFERFDKLNIKQAKEDIYPFIKDKSKIDLWSIEFFKEITKNIQAK